MTQIKQQKTPYLFWILIYTLLAAILVIMSVINTGDYSIAFIAKLFVMNFAIFQVIGGISIVLDGIGFYYLKDVRLIYTMGAYLILAIISATLGIVVLYFLATIIDRFDSLSFSEGSFYAFYIKYSANLYMITIILTFVITRMNLLSYQREVYRTSHALLAEQLQKEKESRVAESVSRKEMDPTGIVIRDGENHYVVGHDEIYYCSAHGKQSVVHTAKKEYLTPRLLKDLETLLPERGFCRIHKSYLLNLSKVSHLQYNMGGSYIAFLTDEENTNLPVSRGHVVELKKRIGMTS